jgi:hypothetical protein
MLTPESPQAALHALMFYTLAHPNQAYFIHQHVVDAYAAQYAEPNGKPVELTFALVGLYLFLEKGYTGRRVQLAHMQLAKTGNTWPRFALPEVRGSIKVEDVLQADPGTARDEMITAWCRSVWEAYRECHAPVKQLLVTTIGL